MTFDPEAGPSVEALHLRMIRHHDPGVAAALVDRETRRRKGGIREVADGNGDKIGLATHRPIDCRAARWAEAEGDAVAFIADPLEFRRWPAVATCARGNRACTPNGEPVRFWHSREWHIERRTGSPVQLTRNCPQLQLAVRLDRRSSVIPKPLIIIG
jgi:hypothetical protein